jgi:tetratricopeptide (TPR) repeat protein
MEETRIEEAGTEGARIEDPGLEEARAEDLEEIDTIIAELEVSKGRGNLILCVVNSPAYRDGIIRVIISRFPSGLIHVDEGGDVIQSLKCGEFSGIEVLIWTMPEKLTEDLTDTLNNFRELFYDAEIPSLVFLSQSFLDDVIRRAPDFWRYMGNYHELKGRDRGLAIETIDALATPLRYQSKEDLLGRCRINEYLLEKVKDEKEAAKILDELGQISYLLGDYDKASLYLKQELKISMEINYNEGVARSLHNFGILAQDTGDIDEARRLYGESLKIGQELGDKSGVARSLHQLGTLAQDTGDIDEARRLYGESQKIGQELGDKSGVAGSLHQLGTLAQAMGDIDEARRLYGESLKIGQELGDKSGVARPLHNLGTLAQAMGDIDEARRLYGESLKIGQELGDKSGVAGSLHNLGTLAQAMGDIDEARRLYGESQKIGQELGDKSGVAFTLVATSHLEEREGNLQTALELIRQAETLLQEIGSPMAEQAQRDRERVEKKIANERMSDENRTSPRRPVVDER